ncbi:right-handed parallel beta-helix repeat-containing protein [Larkinella sp. VNQ87]|uniref:right-handed parallel beta-helix repeat-containing protein n=1 Tax=Larkinella sp. VNQ87 TaxID=3400921 RepID=UPI003C09CDFB
MEVRSVIKVGLVCLGLLLALAGWTQPTLRLNEDRTEQSDTTTNLDLDVVGWMDFAWFQPKGDGVTDDSPKLLQALTLCRTRNLGLLVDPTKTYLLQSPINYTFDGTIAIKSRRPGKPAVFALPDARRLPFRMAATAGSFNSRPAVNIFAGDKTMVLANTTGLSVGDLILIQSSTDWPIETGTKKGEYNIVEAISGHTVTLKQPCQDSYTVSEVSAITNFRPARFFLQDIEISVRKTGNRSVIGLSLANLQSSIINRVTIRNAQYSAMEIDGCYATEVAHCVFENANEEGQGYGIATVGGLLYNVHENRSVGCRKLCDFSSGAIGGPTRLSQAVGNVAIGEGTTNTGKDLFSTDSFCIATHGGAEGILIQGNTATNCRTGFQLRGKDITLNGNRILGRSKLPISLTSGQNHVVTNNTYHCLLKLDGSSGEAPAYANYPSAVIGLSNTLLADGYLTIKNNSFDFVRDYGVYMDGVRQRVLIQYNHFEFNALGGGSPNPVLLLVDQVPARMVGLRVRDNTFNRPSGDLTEVNNLMTLVRADSYPTGDLLDWPTCEVQSLRADAVLRLTTETAETPTQQSLQQLYIDKKDNTVSLSGSFSFRYRNAVQPVLDGLPATELPLTFGFGLQNDTSLYVGRVTAGTGQVVFGAQTGSLGGTFNAGTRYSAGVDIRYRTQ